MSGNNKMREEMVSEFIKCLSEETIPQMCIRDSEETEQETETETMMEESTAQVTPEETTTKMATVSYTHLDVYKRQLLD